VIALVDTSALYALLDRDDRRHGDAVRLWEASGDLDLVAHAYVVVESIALVRARLGRQAVTALIDRLLPAIRTEPVERSLHDEALAEYRATEGPASFVDRVTIVFGRRHGINSLLGFDADLETAGLRPLVDRPEKRQIDRPLSR
jgi:predicted nucleic acid-binding protein